MNDDHLWTVFRVELLSQCELALVAAGQLDAAHEKHEAGQMRGDDELWVAVQSILVIAGNASKLLWGSRSERDPKVEARRKPLRDLAGVTDDSAIRARLVRNRFEHFDEEIEDWYERGDLKVYSSREVSSADEMIWPPAHSRLGHYNPKTGIVNFLSLEASIPDLLAELERIRLNLRRGSSGQ